MKNRNVTLLAGLVLMLACTAQAKLNIVATTPDIAAIAQEITGNKAVVTTLARPTEDPHFIDAKPSFILKLNKADVLIEGGAELETGWLPTLIENARNPKISAGAPGHISCAEKIQFLEVPSSLDRSKGDIHAAGNPHFMTDPINARTVAETISSALSRLDSGNASVYQDNLVQFQARLDKKVEEWKKLLEPYRGSDIVAYHNTWPYFASRFQLKSELFLEPKPGIPPTPAHLAGIIDKMKTGKVKVIIVEPYQNKKTAETVAADTGAQVVQLTQYPGGVKGSEGGYIELMDYLIKTLAGALKNSQ